MFPWFPRLRGHLVYFSSFSHGRDVPGHLTAGTSLCIYHVPKGAGRLQLPCLCLHPSWVGKFSIMSDLSP